VSHNPQAILNICKSSIYLSQGHLVCAGQTDSVMHRYEQDLFLGGSEKVKGIQFLPEKPAHESLGLDITYLLFRDQNGTILDTPITGEPPEFCIGYRTNQTIENAGIILFIQEAASENDLVLLLSSFDDHQTLYITPGEQEAKVIFPYLSLRPGLYIMRITFRKDSLYIFDLVDMFRFTVVSKRSMSKSLFYQPRDWQISCSPDLRQQALSYQSQSV
jgi:lipopolysaccharide transport system ATP-binding protein